MSSATLPAGGLCLGELRAITPTTRYFSVGKLTVARVYVSEIFPTRLRSYGVALAAATQWLFNFVITQVTPAAVNGIGWRTFLMFGIFCMAMGIYVFFFIKETKGRTLESMDILFGAVDQDTREQDLEEAMQTEKEVVGVESTEHVETEVITGKQ